MYFFQLVQFFILMTYIFAEENYEKYYSVFEDHLIRQYGNNNKIVRDLMEKLKDEEVILRLHQDILENNDNLIHELSKYLKDSELDLSSISTPPREENHFEFNFIVSIFFLIGMSSIVLIVIHRIRKQVKRQPKTVNANECKCKVKKIKSINYCKFIF